MFCIMHPIHRLKLTRKGIGDAGRRGEKKPARRGCEPRRRRVSPEVKAWREKSPLKQCRLAAGLTLEELAGKTGMSMMGLSLAENGGSSATVETVMKWAVSCGLLEPKIEKGIKWIMAETNLLCDYWHWYKEKPCQS